MTSHEYELIDESALDLLFNGDPNSVMGDSFYGTGNYVHQNSANLNILPESFSNSNNYYDYPTNNVWNLNQIQEQYQHPQYQHHHHNHINISDSVDHPNDLSEGYKECPLVGLQEKTISDSLDRSARPSASHSYISPLVGKIQSLVRPITPPSSSCSSTPVVSSPKGSSSAANSLPLGTRRVRNSHLAPLCRVQRVRASATPEDLRMIYREYTSRRPIVEIPWPVWIPDAVKPSAISARQSASRSERGGSSIPSVVEKRVKDIFSRSEIVPYMNRCSEVELKLVEKILKTCLTIDIQQPGKKDLLFPWASDIA